MLTSPLVSAQTTQSLSPSIVLVLKLVSTSHVKPVTGVVVSGDGLVLVPADFVAESPGTAASEIIVLDGGTDIVTHGRPATVVQRSMPGGLAMLSVEGLERPGIVLSETTFEPDNKFHLLAFPPAGEIAKGAEPLWLPVDIDYDGLTQTAVSAKTPLPWVTGAILDDCGYLAGLSLADGAQSMQTDRPTEAIFATELDHVLESMQIIMPAAVCVSTQSQPEVPLSGESTVNEAIAQAEPSDPPEHVTPDPEDEIRDSAEPQAVSSLETNAEPSIRTETPGSSERPSIWLSIPAWLIVITLVVLVIAAWKVIAFIRVHTNEPPGKTPGRDSRPQPASDEPETAQLQTDSGTPLPVPRSGRIDDAGMPDVYDLPEGCNAVVVVAGQLDGNKQLRGYCAVNSQQFDVVIGRGKADINIEHPGISRSHARLQCEHGVMTLSDNGSSNGTSIGAIPCLPGEVMYIGPEDDIFLGNICIKIDLIKMKAELS